MRRKIILKYIFFTGTFELHTGILICVVFIEGCRFVFGDSLLIVLKFKKMAYYRPMITESRKKRWVVYVACMAKMGNILPGNLNSRDHLEDLKIRGRAI